MDAIKQLNYFFTEYPYAHMYDVDSFEVLATGKEFRFFDTKYKGRFISKVILKFIANGKIISSPMSFICSKKHNKEIEINAFTQPLPFKLSSSEYFKVKVISMFKTEDEMLRFKTKIKLML